MKVEIWSDFVCPFCYIGKRRFEEALEQFAHKDEIEVVYRSYELDPNSPRDTNRSMAEILASKYGMSIEQAEATNANITEQAAGVGLTYRMDKLIPTNTFDAHRLAHYAGQHGKAHEMTELLLKAYFTDNKHIGDRDTLAALAAEIGLDKNEAAQVLASDQFTQEVRADEQEGADLGISGVPFFVIDRKYGVSGAQPGEVFVQALQKAWDEVKPSLTLVNDASSEAADDACSDGVCGVPPKK
ncbi:DsbA family oxidoreductase [Paenibacillus sp. FJAT-26967]|uniref:DsbA family oxidoreductase n=1 Tax=Paenibacillus sp. FJAT-26967 TaxID=1729690 RepID=UPI0008384A56|nr:DsbA family oxidoreductase [Paenibacillus sp. FJAT-26967]